LVIETTTAVDDAITNNPVESVIETTTAVDDRNYNSS
jgi:hypothetical protein